MLLTSTHGTNFGNSGKRIFAVVSVTVIKKIFIYVKHLCFMLFEE